MECAPKNCGILGFSLLTEAEKRIERKARAEKLYRQGFTEKQIADELGVSRETITKDLTGLVIVTKPPRPKGGRPKGSKKRATPVMDKARAIVRPLIEAGKPTPARKLETEHGISHVQFEAAIAIERVQKDEPQIDASTLSATAQQKLDLAIKQHQRKLDAAFESRVLEEVKRRIDEMILPQWKQRVEQAQKLYKHRRGAMDKTTFNKIRRALHPDSRHSISDEVLAAAFDTFMSLEKFLLDETESPTDLSGLPNSLAEWDKMRATRNRKRSLGAMVSR